MLRIPLWMLILNISWCANREEPKWNLIFEIRSTRQEMREFVRSRRLTDPSNEKKDPRPKGEQMRRSIENKLETRESRVYDLSHDAHARTHILRIHTSKSFRRLRKETRLENKAGTMTRKRVLATTSDGHLNGGTRRTREKTLRGGSTRFSITIDAGKFV